MIATFSPTRTERSTSLTTSISPKRLVRPTAWTRTGGRRLAGRPGYHQANSDEKSFGRVRAGPDDVAVGVAVDADARILRRRDQIIRVADAVFLHQLGILLGLPHPFHAGIHRVEQVEILLVHAHHGVLLAGELRERRVRRQRHLLQVPVRVLEDHVVDQRPVQHREIEPARPPRRARSRRCCRRASLRRRPAASSSPGTMVKPFTVPIEWPFASLTVKPW